MGLDFQFIMYFVVLCGRIKEEISLLIRCHNNSYCFAKTFLKVVTYTGATFTFCCVGKLQYTCWKHEMTLKFSVYRKFHTLCKIS